MGAITYLGFLVTCKMVEVDYNGIHVTLNIFSSIVEVGGVEMVVQEKISLSKYFFFGAAIINHMGDLRVSVPRRQSKLP